MSTRKSSKTPGASLLRKTKKNLSKVVKSVGSIMGIAPKKSNTKQDSSPEMKYHTTYKVQDYIPSISYKLKPSITSEEGFNQAREKAVGIAMNYPRIKESLLQKNDAELKEIYAKYNEIYPQVLDFIQTNKEIKEEIGPTESNVKRAEKIAVAIALKSDIKKSLHSSTRRNKPKLKITYKSKSVSKSKSKSKSATPQEPKPTMGELMKSIQSKPVEEKKVNLTTDDLVSMIHKAQVELREQELKSLRTGKRLLV
jgi:hypothetical protein